MLFRAYASLKTCSVWSLAKYKLTRANSFLTRVFASPNHKIPMQYINNVLNMV